MWPELAMALKVRLSTDIYVVFFMSHMPSKQ